MEKMNVRDLLQCENIRRQLGEVPRPDLYVLDAASTHFVVVELVLLKALMGEGNPGLFISVDRPHQYIVHLLDMHGIAHDGLKFIDAVSRFSGGDVSYRAGVGLLKGPSHIDELPMVLRECSSSGEGFDISGLKFAMIDNVSILLMYNGHQAVEGFLKDFVQLLSARAAVVLVIDRGRYPDLYSTVLSLGGKELWLEPQQGRARDNDVQMADGPNTEKGI